eukprot:6214259-Pleurochrysis_carterae.AAC.3
MKRAKTNAQNVEPAVLSLYCRHFLSSGTESAGTASAGSRPTAGAQKRHMPDRSLVLGSRACEASCGASRQLARSRSKQRLTEQCVGLDDASARWYP